MNLTSKISNIVPGQDMHIRQSFKAKHFLENLFHGLIDPVVMVDHFHMTAPTFETHPHAGISAVTYMFEDSTAPHMNYDSLGNNGPINPGDLHWLVAGRGAIHTEQPEGHNAHVHALQIFVNLPASKKMMEPHAVHLDTTDIPEFLAPGVRVRVVAGESQGIHSPAVFPRPFTLLDGFLEAGAVFKHALPEGWNAFIYVVKGTLMLKVDSEQATLQEAHGIGVGGAATLQLSANDPMMHFVILSGPALNEPLVKHGPFVMSTHEQMQDRIRAFHNGEFGEMEMGYSRDYFVNE